MEINDEFIPILIPLPTYLQSPIILQKVTSWCILQQALILQKWPTYYDTTYHEVLI